MEINIEQISPNVARYMLATSLGNRSLKQSKIRSYTRDMQNGLWKLNGETIIFDEDGHLVDGHHRLMAVVASGSAITAAVARGARSEDLNTIDMGASRTIGDVLHFSGYKNTNLLNAIVFVAMSLRNGKPRSANASSSEVLAFIDKYPLVEQSAHIAAKKVIRRVNSVVGALHLISNELGQAHLFNGFHDVLRSGIPSYDGCPAHFLRDKMMLDSVAKRPLTLNDAHRFTVHAWNKWLDGETMRTSKLPKDYFIKGWTRK